MVINGDETNSETYIVIKPIVYKQYNDPKWDITNQ